MSFLLRGALGLAFETWDSLISTLEK